jgi:4a-hydroxytetrahydrobiopterin dehydratase
VTAARLSDQEIGAALSGGDLPGWTYQDGELVKEFALPSFRGAIAFIGRIADAAEAADHHPDLENHYRRVTVRLHTWSERAVTEKDLALARAIEAQASVRNVE